MAGNQGSEGAGKLQASSKRRPIVQQQDKAVVKYKKYEPAAAQDLGSTKKAPSHLIQALSRPQTHVQGWRPKPKIIELLNIAEYSHQVNCSVPVDEPIFQPFPPEVTFSGYEAFKEYEALLCLRNNDVVPRSVKIEAPDSQYFSIQRLNPPQRQLTDGTLGASAAKVASGMEVVYSVCFRPQSVDDYHANLVMATEREKYIVPLIAVGTQPALDLPDVLQFGQQLPTKLTCTQVVLVRNIGSRQAVFNLRTSQHFGVSPKEGNLAPGQVMQLRISFTPPAAGNYEGELELQYTGSGLTAYTQLRGSSADLDVGLSQSSVTLLPTYVTKTSQKTFKVMNRSSEPVQFAIKAAATQAEDLGRTEQRVQELQQERSCLHSSMTGVQASDDSEDEEVILSAGAGNTLTQTLKDKQRNLELDQQLFGTTNFSCEPASGIVMPNSECEVVVHFTPDYAREYNVTAYVDIQGATDRLPINFLAQGLGPTAVFSYDMLDVGDTYANTLHQYEVELQNRGKIDVHFGLVPSCSAFGSKFKFEPETGHLSGGEIQVIKVKLLSDLLGPFDEVFRWAIKGSANMLSLQLKGRVCGPTCEADVDSLDFGMVSYGFRYSKEFTLTNTSEIPMRFAWRVPEDAGVNPPEFQVLPQRGSILPQGKQKVVVELTSHTVQRYTTHRLALDIPDVLQEQLVLPLRAECAVPRITTDANPLEFGDCFVRYEYTRTLTLQNQSKLPAKFEIVPQDVHSMGLATWTAEPSSGVVPAIGEQQIMVTLCTQTLGRVQLPLRVLVPGSKGRPLEVAIDAKSTGPHLLLGAAGEDVASLKSDLAIAFGSIPALQPSTYQLQVHNPCLIPASCKLFIENTGSVFSVSPAELQLAPGTCSTVLVKAVADDIRMFQDVLHVLIAEGADVCIPLTAAGTGHTLVCEALSGPVLEFSHQFVGRPFQKELVVANHGRKQLELQWSNQRLDEVRQAYSKVARASGKKFSIDIVPPEERPLFTISPERATLASGECVNFTFAGLALKPGDMGERLVCNAMGLAGKSAKPVFDVSAHALVATPLLDMSSRSMTFHHRYTPGQPITTLVQPLTIRNISKLPLSCQVKVSAPFSVDKSALQLALFEGATLNVSFDPAYKGDQQSGVVQQKLQITYQDNPQRDAVDLVGIMDYPNMSLDKTEVAFGSCLSDTTKRVPLTLTNTSAVDVVYRWAWDQDTLKEDTNSIASVSLKQSRQPRPPANQLFDILPIKGVLQPGESTTASCSFFAYPGVKASVTAMCLVEGGPTYQVPLSGESNNIKYAIEPHFIDMGQQLFIKPIDKELIISNQGKVPFDFNINTRLLSRPSIVTPIPRSGVIAAGQKQSIKLRILPGIPERLLESIQVELAHFDPITVQLVVEGVYPAVLLSLPRVTDDTFKDCLQEAKDLRRSPSAHYITAFGESGLTAGIAQSVTGRRGPASIRSTPVGADNRSLAGGFDSRSIAGSVARSVAPSIRSVAKSAKSAATAAGGKPAKPASADLPPEKKLELAAERLRLVKLIAGVELQQIQAAEQALLDAELQHAQAQQQLQEEADEASPADEAGSGDLQEVNGLIDPAAAVDTTSAGADIKVAAAGDAVSKPPAEFHGFKNGRRTEPIQPPLPSLAAAHYMLDFGCIIKGTTKTKKFKITNPSSQAVTFRWDRAVLESWGLKAEPEAVSKLPGGLESGSVELSLSLVTKQRVVGLGPMQVTLPLPIKGSIPVLVTVKADVQIPDVEVSQEVLQFGRVQTGKCKAITVQLYNTKPVACEWEVKRPVEATKAADWSFFRCEPSQGIVEPGSRTSMRVIFTPTLQRETTYQQTIPIKISNNSRNKELQCSGAGDTPRVVFEPGVVNCGAIMPAKPGQAPNEARVQLVNPCPFPVEVISLDWDTQYKADEEVLRGLDEATFNELGVHYEEPLSPGQTLWPDMVTAHAQKQALLAAQAAAAAEASQNDQAGVGELEPIGMPAAAAEVQATEAAPKEAPNTIIVVHGTRLSGMSTQAAQLADRYSLPVLTFDDLLFEGADVEAPPPEPGLSEAPQQETLQPAMPPASTGSVKAAKPNKQPAAAAVPAAPEDPDVITFDTALSDQLYGRVFTDPELESQPGFVPPHTKLAEVELQDMLLRGIKQALQFSSRLGGGLVLDSLSSRYCPPAVAMRLLLQAAGLKPVLPPEVVDPKAKSKPKPAKGSPDTPPAPTVADAWEGLHRVFVVTLQPEQQVLQQRLSEEKAAKAAAVAAAAEEAATIAAAAVADTGTVPETPAPVTAAATSGTGSDADAAVDAEAAAAAAAAELQAEVQLLLDSNSQVVQALQQLVGQPAGAQLADGRVVASNQVHLLQVPVTAGQSQEQLTQACCGIQFKLGRRLQVLPELPSDAHLIPPPYCMQVVTRPRERPPRQPIAKFKLYTVSPAAAEPPADEARPGKSTPPAGAQSPAKAAKGKAPVVDTPQLNPLYKPATRWVVPANSTQELVVLFQSEELGRFTELLGFEVVGGDKLVSLPLQGVCDYPHISSDYRNVFMRKVKARPSTPSVCRQFITSSNTFEFGPLLLGKDPAGYLDGAHPENTTKLRITNNGLFPAHVDLGFKSRSSDDSKPKKPGTAPAKADKGGGIKTQLDGVFVLSHTALDLAVDETQEVMLYAFPQQEGSFEDSLALKVADNPEPVAFPVSVVGARPQLRVRLDDGSPDPYAAAAATAAAAPPPAAETKPKTPPKGNKPQTDAGPVNKLLTDGMVFERLLIGKHETQTMILTNPGVLPVHWRLIGVDSLPPELKVFPSSGRLEARSDVHVAVEFTALHPREVAHQLTLEALDVAELLGVASATPIAIKAEAHKLDVDVRFPQEGHACLDFGTMRVCDSKQLPLVLRNNGKYAIKFAFSLRSAAARELITLQPESGSVEPGKDVSLAVSFNSNAVLSRELTLTNAPDIQLAIIEPLSQNKADTVTVRASVRAVYSRYNITPARGIIFGPLTYNTTSKPRTFEICNTGDFAFDFSVYNLANRPASQHFDAKDKKAAAKPVASKGGKGGANLMVGQFTVEPCEGSVAPGTKVEVAVTFKAEGSQVYREQLGIDISQRPGEDCPAGIPYEVVGESCVPGIDTSSLESIFEEHTISSSLDPTGIVPRQLGLRERAFSFGPVVAQLTGATEGAPAPASKDKKGAAASSSGPLEGGIQAAIKFSNPVKVPCTLNLSLKPKTPAVDPKAPTAFPMSVYPSQIIIPPQESRYTTLYFAPTAIAQYSATLEAVVDGGTDARTKSFSCEVRGQGTLPTLSLLELKNADAQGQPVLSFGRLLLGRSAQLNINLKNNGQLPASSRLDVTPHPAFSVQPLSTAPGTFTVEPGRGAGFAVTFQPQEVGQFKHEVRLKVQRNPFEEYCIKLTGEGYQDDVTFDMLPDDQLDTLRLPDASLNEQKQVVFSLRNCSAVKHFRFKWPNPSPSPCLTVSPACGHLHAGTCKDITLTLQSAAPVKLSPATLKMALTQITYLSGDAQDWDDRSQLVEYDEQGNAQRKPEPEPKVADVAGGAKELALAVWATADTVRYTSGAPTEGIIFKPTMMFQTRTFAFPLTNPSTCRLHYKFSVMDASGTTPDTTGLYTISPEGGAVEAGSTVNICVRFSPQEVVDCARWLVADMAGMDPSQPQLRVQMDAHVLRPWCHFELQDSDYIAGGRREPGLPGPSGAVEPLDPATKVLEFESLGVRVRNTKRFLVLNPTAVGYSFQWEPQGAASASATSSFRCVTRKGTIGPGRQFEMVFEYTPMADEKTEAFWVFSIPEQSISLPFLLVGHVCEPRVGFDMPCLNFGQCLVGGARGHGAVNLLNNEDLPFSFSLDTASYDASEQQMALVGRKPVVEFSPVTGVVPPRGSVTLQATFSPAEERLYNYNVVCKVANKPTKLSLNVKGEGYAIRQVLQLETPDGGTLPLAPTIPHHINFGQVIVNERSVKALALLNTGSLAYDFVWDSGTNPRIKVIPESGTVAKGQRCALALSYHPHGAERLRDCRVTCQIVNGPTYSLLLQGAGHKPRLDLSFLSHDFGTCALWQPSMLVTTKTLRLTNNDTQPVSVDPQWAAQSNTPTEHEVWGLQLPACVLQPGESKEGIISFKPSETRPYNQRLLLEINGLYTVGVDFTGEGAPLCVEPVTAAQQVVNFGAVQRGSSCSRTTALVNRGRMTVQLALGQQAQELLTRQGIQVMPAVTVTLRPRERVDYTFLYWPSARQPQWSESLHIDVNGVQQPLLRLQGSCSGTQLSLASDVLPFGPVAQGSSTTKRLALDNNGDVGTKFSWDTHALGPHFQITPTNGFLAAGQSAKLEVVFKPHSLSADIRAERIRCKVEGGEDQYLTLTGACFEASAQPDALNFSCAVRDSVTQSVQLDNPTSAAWQLRPTVSGEMFSAPELVDVPANSKVAYTITYRPLQMTTASQPHEGSVFFGIPDGSGLLYRLVGSSTTPKPLSSIERSIAAKQTHTELLTVNNWLSRPQRFRVIVDKKQGDVSTQLDAAQYVDVPAHSSKEVKLTVYSYTATTTVACVTFKNEDSGEYSYYDIKLVATAPGRQGTLTLDCPVRVATTAHVTVRNPLTTPITLKGSASHKLVKVPATTTVEPQSSAQVPITFRPLLETAEEAVLKLECAELGLFEWGLQLRGAATNPEKALSFNVPLGGREVQVFRFTHWLEEKADYKVSFASGAKGMFEAAASVSVPAAPAGGLGQEAQLEVAFEPNCLGDQLRDTLILSSATAGQYSVPLLGTCVAPRPQGPVDCAKGSGSVPFKNVFAADAEFFYSVDNPAFTVKTSEKVAAKKAASISVSFKPDAKLNSSPSRTGKLTVTCPSQTSVSWVFYLQA